MNLILQRANSIVCYVNILSVLCLVLKTNAILYFFMPCQLTVCVVEKPYVVGFGLPLDSRRADSNLIQGTFKRKLTVFLNVISRS
jgi:hypothetical protein